jgi:putative transposase
VDCCCHAAFALTASPGPPSPQTNGVIERFFGTLKYEHLFRAPIDDGGALAMDTARFRDIYNRIRPHQALGDRTPRAAYLDGAIGASF